VTFLAEWGWILGWTAMAICIAIFLGLLISLLMSMFSSLRGRAQAEPGQAEIAAGQLWEFSPDDYRPMERLLDEEDLAFLRAQPGYRPEMGRRWRKQRYALFREYLAELKADFGRLHAQARALTAHSDEKGADLVAVLLRQQFTFHFAVLALEWRLLLQQAGIGQVNIAPLLALIESMRLDLANRQLPQSA
jgi:hypothetical protein